MILEFAQHLSSKSSLTKCHLLGTSYMAGAMLGALELSEALTPAFEGLLVRFNKMRGEGSRVRYHLFYSAGDESGGFKS